MINSEKRPQVPACRAPSEPLRESTEPDRLAGNLQNCRTRTVLSDFCDSGEAQHFGFPDLEKLLEICLPHLPLAYPFIHS